MIKAIETKYNGHKFRSRLEARWAVLFDSLGFKWEYEKEGYDLGEIGWYLPDFYLPEFNCWIEIKGDSPSDNDLEKCQIFSLLMFGEEKEYDAILTFNTEIMMNEAKRYEDDCGGEGRDIVRRKVNSEGKVYLFCGVAENGFLALPNFAIQVSPKDVLESLLFFSNNRRQVKVRIPGQFHPRKIFPACVVAARSARFEHGECG
jgi:hypothetical protein